MSSGRFDETPLACGYLNSRRRFSNFWTTENLNTKEVVYQQAQKEGFVDISKKEFQKQKKIYYKAKHSNQKKMKDKDYAPAEEENEHASAEEQEDEESSVVSSSEEEEEEREEELDAEEKILNLPQFMDEIKTVLKEKSVPGINVKVTDESDLVQLTETKKKRNKDLDKKIEETKKAIAENENEKKKLGKEEALRKQKELKNERARMRTKERREKINAEKLQAMEVEEEKPVAPKRPPRKRKSSKSRGEPVATKSSRSEWDSAERHKFVQRKLPIQMEAMAQNVIKSGKAFSAFDFILNEKLSREQAKERVEKIVEQNKIFDAYYLPTSAIRDNFPDPLADSVAPTNHTEGMRHLGPNFPRNAAITYSFLAKGLSWPHHETMQTEEPVEEEEDDEYNLYGMN